MGFPGIALWDCFWLEGLVRFFFVFGGSWLEVLAGLVGPGIN